MTMQHATIVRTWARATFVSGIALLFITATTLSGGLLDAATPFEGTSWQLTQYLGPNNTQVPALASAAPTATFAGGMLTGSTGCNSYTATYTLETSHLTISPGATTLRACEDPVATQEHAFLAALPTVTGYTITGTTLMLTNASSQTVLTFAPMASPTGGTPATGAVSATLTGTVTYRERIALPAGAVINVQLTDTSRADAPAMLIGEQTITTTGEQVPIPFNVAYDPASIIANHMYTVRATISVGGNVLFRTTSASLVLTNGNPTRVELVLTMTGGSAVSPPAAAPTSAAPTSATASSAALTGNGGTSAFIRRLGDG
jgi:putative lipoprotein